jgi:osmotically-inducible protein OsmY
MATAGSGSDELREAVLRKLWSQKLSVRTRNGTIALFGVVHSYEEKIAAGDLVKSVYGAKGVANYISVKQ